MNKSAHQRGNKTNRLLHPGASASDIRCDHAVAPFDRLALDMDRTWGISQLPGLVSPTTAEKYGRAFAHLNATLDAGDPDGVAAAAANCVRGMMAMDAEARANGHKPANPDVWEFELDGHRFGVIRDVSDWPPAAQTRPGLTLYTMRQVAIALAAQRNAVVATMDAPAPAKAINRPMSPIGQDIDDEIPF